MNDTQFDIIVVGGGLVGASLALALAESRQRVALVEAHEPEFSHLDEGWDARLYAISPVNRRFLERLDAWPGEERLGTIEEMDVAGDAGGRIRFAASDAGAQALAWIAENRWLLASIWQRLAESQVERICGALPTALMTTPSRAELTLADGRVLGTRLLVGADGANSWVRAQAGLAARIDAYGHSGVVANFECERPHGNIARQWFTGDSILAWLPMAGNRVSMVWSTSDPEALLALSAEELALKVAAAGGNELGRFETITPAAAFPLRMIRLEATVAERVVLLGDAAHTVHPLAGQGVNLGFQDAAALADLLRNAVDPGDWMLLRRHARSRLEAVRTMQLTCDGLFRLFNGKGVPGLSWLRNTGLTMTGRIAPIKRQLARHAIGF
ncbi:UbiH/UbiF family hydroxylase [Crenobacter sp. SG2305]|uniref:UbiH/UbiF family hydroxylase n=1 Tax=Crenobacter oryzisoli TaxID=3056844 RepID=UPI0025AAD3C8|nr:UbiH/UbiF family hydroxylase [Crenobacter sp. SG2305]MDN0083433.1 UbiH/UbiF family hydroxylase [Crenobacter sp. SG2305]